MIPFNHEYDISRGNALDDVLKQVHARRGEGWWVILGPTEVFDGVGVLDWIVYMIRRERCEYVRSEEPDDISILVVDFDDNKKDPVKIWAGGFVSYVNANTRVIALKGTPQGCLEFFKTAPLTESN